MIMMIVTVFFKYSMELKCTRLTNPWSLSVADRSEFLFGDTSVTSSL